MFPFTSSHWIGILFPVVIIFLLYLRPLQNHLYRLVVVSLDLEVGDPAVPLCGRDLTMPQEVLNGSKVCIGVEELRGHRVAKAMAGNVEFAFSRIVLHPLLNASYRYRLPLRVPFCTRNNLFPLGLFAR